MKKSLNKIKTILTTLWIIIISFSSKVFGQVPELTWFKTIEELTWNELLSIIEQRSWINIITSLYWVPGKYEIIETSTSTGSITRLIKITQRILIPLIFIIWIIILIKMRKIENKTKWQKIIKRVVIAILSIIIAVTISYIVSKLQSY